jgi:hypothetical protein
MTNPNTYRCICRNVFIGFLSFAEFPSSSIDGITRHEYDCVTRNVIRTYILDHFGQDIGSVINSFL